MSHTQRVNAGARSFILAFKNGRGRPGTMSTFTGGQEGGGRREEGGGRREEGGGLFLQSLPWVQMFSSVLTHCSG